MSAYDARERTYTWLTTNDVLANITKDNDTTQASVIYTFEKPPYPIERVFFDPKNVDGIYTIKKPTSRPHHDWKHETYAYTERVPIQINCVTKQGITGDLLQWKMEKELRRIEETYPLSSVRNLESVSPTVEDMGVWKLFGVTYFLEYKRAADSYTSDVTLSYGNKALGTGFHYGGDRLDNGVEGQWGDGASAVDNDGGSTITQSIINNILTLTCTVYVGDAYTNNATNLALSTNAAKKIRFRYRTTENATAKIVVTDDAAYSQTVLAETASSDWSVVSVSLTAAKTADHIRVYLCDGTGTVEVDWIEIYAADYVLPNAVDIRPDPTSRNINLGIPSGIVLGGQNLGADPEMLEIDCDLDMQTSETAGADGCWKRTGDTDKDEIFRDIIHNQSIDAPWQWLVYGNKSMRVQIDSAPTRWKDGVLTLRLREYSESNMDDSYTERWNL